MRYQIAKSYLSYCKLHFFIQNSNLFHSLDRENVFKVLLSRLPKYILWLFNLAKHVGFLIKYKSYHNVTLLAPLLSTSLSLYRMKRLKIKSKLKGTKFYNAYMPINSLLNIQISDYFMAHILRDIFLKILLHQTLVRNARLFFISFRKKSITNNWGTGKTHPNAEETSVQ